ncbi:MAG: ribosome maturation factor RimM [Bacteroidales bacterium]|nr:ribosome maturation factor RimM [Bacteroidales bacterium]
MKQDDCYYLGYVTKTFGYKGEVFIFLDVDDPSYYKELESVFILLGGKLIPFFVQKISLRPNSPEAVVRFQDVDTPEKAQHLAGSELYLPLELLPPLKGNAFYFHEIVGYEVIDKQYGDLGKITGVLEFPGNPVFQIQAGKKEVLIPANDQIIERLDRQNKKIHINAPEGLIDLYLNE